MGLPIFSLSWRTLSASKMSRRRALDISRWLRMSLRTISRSSVSKSRRGGEVLAWLSEGGGEEVEAFEFWEQGAQALLVIVQGAAEAVDVVDGEEGVFVDGVAVVAVADDEGVDAVERGDGDL